jgi:tRNA1Val (adenine37-N6)-methyltransferase
MPEDVFRFKHFMVRQSTSGMRITTDACVFGAYVAMHASPAAWLLDVGAGTGLLSLMLAQKISGSITALEINPTAFEEARFNFKQSDWSHRLAALKQDARTYSRGGFGTLICNPPFFDGESRSEKEDRRQAMHQVTMEWAVLIEIMQTNLSKEGEAWVLLPYEKALFVERLAMEQGLYLKQRLDMAESSQKPWLRTVLAFGRGAGGFRKKETLYFKNDQGSYTQDFRALLKDYYLDF